MNNNRISELYRKSFFIFGTAIVFIFAVHFFYFALNDGLCSTGETGRIAGNQASGAGALPRFYDNGRIPTLSLDLLRPLSTRFAFISDLICIVTFILILYCLRNISSSGSSMEISLFISLIIFIVSTSFAECGLSCELDLVHKNIQFVFENRPIGISIDDLLSGKDQMGIQLSEIRGRNGEPTCRAFVSKAKILQSSAYAEFWTDYSSLHKSDDPNIKAIATSLGERYSTQDLKRLYLSIGSFSKDHDLGVGIGQESSVIACLKWPYGWASQLP